MEYVLTTDHLCKNYGHFIGFAKIRAHMPVLSFLPSIVSA